MRAITYTSTGGPEVLQLSEREPAEPGPGEVRVRVAVSGVNPTDWKTREGAIPGRGLAFPEAVPNQDGAGTVDAVGPGVDGVQVGQRVWLLLAADQRPTGTAQELTVLPAERVVPLPEGASFDLGASHGDARAEIAALVPDGVHLVVEVSPARNAELNARVTANGAVIAVYANDGGDTVSLDVRRGLSKNLRYQFLLLYTLPAQALAHAVADVSAAVAAGVLEVGEEHGLPLHRFPLARTADAHSAVKAGVTGKVLIDVAL
jgi:NADPH:quinone reductase-like Zn-dependent oxidoreductase